MTQTDSFGSRFDGTVVVTGATGGLGRALLDPLARRRPEHLVLLGRSPAAMARAADDARAAGARFVSTVAVDLSDLGSVASAGAEVHRLTANTGARVRALLMVAGVQHADRKQVSAQGIESTFAVNIAAQHLLLRTIEPAFAREAHAVLVSSGTHLGDWHSYGLVPPPRWADPAAQAIPDPAGAHDRNAGARAYATSKLDVVHLAHAWAARGETHFRVNAFDPGLMPGTGLARAQSGAGLWAWRHLMPTLTFLPGWSTPSRSADHLASLALGATHPDLNGGYVELGKARPSAPESYDAARESRLWDVLEQLTAPFLQQSRANAAESSVVESLAGN